MVHQVRERVTFVSQHGSSTFVGVSNTAGGALWALDYSLFATQVGISRLHFHEGIGYKYNFVSTTIQHGVSLTLCLATIRSSP